MKIRIAIAAGFVGLSCAAPASAQPTSRDYTRGYYDCLAGRYDDEHDNRSYRRGCRAAQREQEAGEQGMGGPPSYPGAGQDGPPPGGWGGSPPYPRDGMNRRPPPYPPGGMGGGPAQIRPAAGLPNLRGMETTQATVALASRGFASTGAQGVGAAILGFYYNRGTGECAQVAFTNGRVADAQLIGSSPHCR